MSRIYTDELGGLLPRRAMPQNAPSLMIRRHAYQGDARHFAMPSMIESILSTTNLMILIYFDFDADDFYFLPP